MLRCTLTVLLNCSHLHSNSRHSIFPPGTGCLFFKEHGQRSYPPCLTVRFIVKVVSLEPPFGECNTSNPVPMSNCQIECRTEMLVEKCGCRDIYMKNLSTGTSYTLHIFFVIHPTKDYIPFWIHATINLSLVNLHS